MKLDFPTNKLHYVVLLIVFLFPSCETEKEKTTALRDIDVVKVIQRDTPIYEEFVGQLYGLKDIPIRARVEGFLEKISFNEGRRVKKGQLLYVIDAQPFLAEVAAKMSDLAQANTILVNAQNELDRYIPLAEINAVSKSDLDAAQASRDAAISGVDAAEANLELAEINLSYTQIQSPISGLIGKTEAREGEFVGRSPNPVILNTVSRIDTVRVQFFLTEANYLRLAKEFVQNNRTEKTNSNGEVGGYNLELILSDGSVYDMKGKIDFINRNVDPKTGSMLVQAHFPNPDGLLRPGLYAKVKAEMEFVKNALLIPSRCVSEMQGQYSVMVLNADSAVESRSISIGGHIGDMVMVSEGLGQADQIVYEGLQKIASGTKVNPRLVEFESKTNLD
jgi:membrane fusion protein (multidrug efflux system)